MTEIDIYIDLFNKLEFKSVNFDSSFDHNVLIYEGYIKDVKFKAKVWFNFKNELVSSISCEPDPSKFIRRGTISYTKNSFSELYKDLIRDIKLKECIND